MNAIAAVTQANVRVDLLRKAHDALELWPAGVHYDVGVKWVYASAFRVGQPRFGSLAGLVGLQDWATVNGFRTVRDGSIAGAQVRATLHHPFNFPSIAMRRTFVNHVVCFTEGAVQWFGRAAVARFFGIGEWDAGRVFDLYGDEQTIPQVSNVSHKLAQLIKQHGG